MAEWVGRGGWGSAAAGEEGSAAAGMKGTASWRKATAAGLLGSGRKREGGPAQHTLDILMQRQPASIA